MDTRVDTRCSLVIAAPAAMDGRRETNNGYSRPGGKVSAVLTASLYVA